MDHSEPIYPKLEKIKSYSFDLEVKIVDGTVLITYEGVESCHKIIGYIQKTYFIPDKKKNVAAVTEHFYVVKETDQLVVKFIVDKFHRGNLEEIENLYFESLEDALFSQELDSNDRHKHFCKKLQNYVDRYNELVETYRHIIMARLVNGY